MNKLCSAKWCGSKKEALDFPSTLNFSESRQFLTFLFDLKIKCLAKQELFYGSSILYNFSFSRI